MIAKQYLITPAAGKRIIAQSMLYIPEIIEALRSKTIVIVAGTTNGYIAEEMLRHVNQSEGFSMQHFFRGITLPSWYKRTESGRLPDESAFRGDVIIKGGVYEKNKTVFDVMNDLQKGDIVIKGANAVNIELQQAAVLIGHPQAGTTGAIMQVVIGKRVQLYIPVGLEKRLHDNINELSQMINATITEGVRYFPITGNIITELDAIQLVTGAQAKLFAAGGVGGAEGSYWILVSGSKEQIQKMDEWYTAVKNEPNFII